MRVLIAGSNETRLAKMHEMLEAAGRFEVLRDSMDGDTVLKNAAAADAIILDREINGRGWLGVLSDLLRMERPPRIVVITPIKDPSIHRAARREGADDILVWPSEASELPARLVALERQL